MLAKDLRSNWTTELDIETLEPRRSWATLSEVQSVIPFHEDVKSYRNCILSPSSVKTGDMTFVSRFDAAYMFLKVKGCRPMTYQHLTLRMYESEKKTKEWLIRKYSRQLKGTALIGVQVFALHLKKTIA